MSLPKYTELENLNTADEIDQEIFILQKIYLIYESKNPQVKPLNHIYLCTQNVELHN
jgi:hypothetical protein